RLVVRANGKRQESYYGREPVEAVRLAEERIPKLLNGHAPAIKPSRTKLPAEIAVTYHKATFVLKRQSNGQYRLRLNKRDTYYGTDPARAKELALERVPGLLDGTDGLIEEQPGDHTLNQAADEWLRVKEATVAPRTYGEYKRKVKGFRKVAPEVMRQRIDR